MIAVALVAVFAFASVAVAFGGGMLVGTARAGRFGDTGGAQSSYTCPMAADGYACPMQGGGYAGGACPMYAGR